MAAQRGDGRECLASLPLARTDALAQVTLNSLAWPLRTPLHAGTSSGLLFRRASDMLERVSQP